MDSIETLSDCSESSRNSECLSSNVSTLSGLSEYQGEFLELRQLINSESNLVESKKSNTTATNIVQWYEKQINDLSLRLQQSVQQNEKYKNDMYDFQKRSDISHGEKIDRLLKQNQKLEANLSAANNQIQRLISIHNRKDDGETALLAEKILQLEQSNHELINQNYLLSSKVNHCNFHKNEIESEYNNLKSEFNELKLELAAKVSGANELKKKITEQHVQMQEFSQNNVKLSHSLDVISNELQFVKKSESWYKNELRHLQQEKSNLWEQLLENEKVIAAQEEKIETLKVELTSFKCFNEELHLDALKEKERMFSRLEFAEQRVKDESSNVSTRDLTVESITKYYDTVVNDLTSEVVKIKSDLEFQQRSFEKTAKEKSDLTGKCLSLQNCLQDKDNVIHTLENNIRDLKEKLASALDMQMKQNSEMLDLKRTCTVLKNELDLKNEEKKNFEKSITTVKEQFKIFINKYENLKNEVYRKNKEILQLQYEKEELSVDKNKKIYELKQLSERDALEIEKFRGKISQLQALNESMESESMLKTETIEHLNCEMMKIQADFNKQIDSFSHENVTSRNDTKMDTPNVIDILKHICQMCTLSDDFVTNNDFVTTVDGSKDYIRFLVDKIHSHLQLMQTKSASKHKDLMECRKKFNILKKNVLSRIAKLMDRCKLLEVRNEENIKMLHSLCNQRDKKCSLCDEVQNLRTQLQVKVQDAKDKQKRYERNYRTLLRKVKEHMKGRNVAEKHSSYLQDLYDTLSEDSNTLRLQLDLKNSEIREIQNRLENSSNTNEKLKSRLIKLENKLLEAGFCTKCVDFETLKKRELELEKMLKNYENCNTTNILDLKVKEDVIENFQKENQKLLLEISSKSAECKDSMTVMEKYLHDNKILSAKCQDLETKFSAEKILNEQIKQDLINIKNSASKARSDYDQLIDKNEYLVQEIKHINSCLQRKSEEINELQLRKQHSVNRWLEKEQNMQNLISDLKNQLLVFKNDIDVMKNEKFFLQRLCNDLKVALKTQINHNKGLKNCLEKICKEKEENDNNSVALSHFPSPVKYDDVYIDRLLQENKMPIQDKPFCDIQECLNTLRKEILFLQKQIVEKNVS